MSETEAPEVSAGSWFTWVCYTEKWVVQEPPLSSVLLGGLPEIQIGVLTDIIAAPHGSFIVHILQSELAKMITVLFTAPQCKVTRILSAFCNKWIS